MTSPTTRVYNVKKLPSRAPSHYVRNPHITLWICSYIHLRARLHKFWSLSYFSINMCRHFDFGKKSELLLRIAEIWKLVCSLPIPPSKRSYPSEWAWPTLPLPTFKNVVCEDIGYLLYVQKLPFISPITSKKSLASLASRWMITEAINFNGYLRRHLPLN